MFKKPGLSSSTLYGFPASLIAPLLPETPALSSRSTWPAHAAHWIGFRAGLLSTMPVHRSRIEASVSRVMSRGRAEAGAGAEEGVGVARRVVDRRECS